VYKHACILQLVLHETVQLTFQYNTSLIKVWGDMSIHFFSKLAIHFLKHG